MSQRLANLFQSLGWATINTRKSKESKLSADDEIELPLLGGSAKGVTVVSHSK